MQNTSIPAPSAASEPRLLTRQELAARLRVSHRTVDNLIAEKAIEYIRVRGSVRFSPAGVEKYLPSGTVAGAV
ncbi:MAG TPA: helix-turn-helix domain-containing protein [Verrucomicrobiales bacterium]|nr:helix-turn-helix domain-containing protein [Verrucomicrobiales bacterium]